VLDVFKPQNVEALKVKYEIVPYTKGLVLDLGCGPWKTYPHFIGVDLREGWPEHIPWRPDIVLDARNLSVFQSRSMDAAFSSYLLQCFEEPLPVLREWWRVIKFGGHLILYLPLPDHENYDSKLTPAQVTEWMQRVGSWDLLVNENREQSFFQVYKKTHGKKHQFSCLKPKPEKTCAVIRYGGFGDMIQTSSVLPELKKQGYHVTLYTSEAGYQAIKADPNVDEFIVQQTDQVPNSELGEYWAVLKTKYDKFINLSESVEGTLLALPGRTVFNWPKQAKHKVTNINYLELMHDIAEVPFNIHTRFYPLPDEVRWAKKKRKKFSGKVVLWTLSGSSVHKCWPYMDQIIARLLIEYRDITVILVGDELSQILESGWEKEPRVVCASGRWSIRQTLTFAEYADVVIGPETGVMNAVSMLNMPKIIFLSHSSIENLTRDWVNTTSLTPDNCPCYPCHMMHYGFKNCSRDPETGVAECQAKISPEKVWEALKKYLGD